MTKASDESNIKSYNLYWGSSTSVKLSTEAIASFSVTGKTQNYTIASNTKIPAGATTLLAFSSNAKGEMASPTYVLIVDKGVPVHAPVSASFTDSHPEAGKASGI